MYGKLINLSSEVEGSHLGSEYFKKIVTGDTINGAFLYRDSFDFNPFVKLVFAMNKNRIKSLLML